MAKIGRNKLFTHVAMKAAPTSVRERVQRLHRFLRAAPFVNQWKDAPATVARCDQGDMVSTIFARD